MKIPKKVTFLTFAMTVIGFAAKTFIAHTGASPTVSTTVNATNGSFVISGQGNQVNDVYIQNFQNASTGPAPLITQSPNAQTAASPLVGKWFGTSWYDVPGANLTSSGYSEFLPSGAYNFSGEFMLRDTAKLEPDALIISKVVAAGTWQLQGGKYVLTLTDLQTTSTVKRRPGQADVDLDLAAHVAGAPPVRLQRAIPKGATQEFALLELGPTSMRSTGQDLPGHRIDYAATRVQ